MPWLPWGLKHLGAQTARTAYNSTIQAISHSFMPIPIVTRRHTTGSKGKPVAWGAPCARMAWAQECMATHLTCPSHSHVKPPKLTQRQWPGRGGWRHLGAQPGRIANTMLAISICILTTASQQGPIILYTTRPCNAMIAMGVKTLRRADCAHCLQ